MKNSLQEDEEEGIVKIVERGNGEVEELFRWILACGKTWPFTESLSLLCAIDPAFDVSEYASVPLYGCF